MKKTLCILLMICMISTLMISSVSAMNYTSQQANTSSFETLEEARVSAITEVAKTEPDAVRTYVPNPALDSYPAGTTYVYRSAAMYGGIRASGRLNTNIIVLSDKTFDGKDAALSYLKELEITDIIDEAIGSAILVTPANAETGFGAADLANLNKLLDVMSAQKASARVGEETFYYPDGEYFGGGGYLYVIGIDGGATFANDYVAYTLDTVGRIAGMLLVNGTMQTYRKVASYVPVYLVNADEATVEKYKEVNGTDAYASIGDAEIYFNQAAPVRQVIASSDETPDLAGYIKDAYSLIFKQSMRASITGGNLPHALTKRNAVVNGKTEDGVYVTFHSEDRFSSITTPDGEFLQTWFEVLPEEVVNNTAPAATIPLILGMHGMGDDPLMFIDGTGLLNLAGDKRVAVVAPEHQAIFWTMVDGQFVEGIELEVVPQLVQYMLDTYPALDPSRVYVTGYSMGGWATMKALHASPSLYAAAVPMSGMGHTGTAEQIAQFDSVDIPILITTSTRDLGVVFDEVAGHIGISHQTQVKLFLGFNGMSKFDEFDFSKYPVAGFKADSSRVVTLNGEHLFHSWFLNNDDGVPMVGLGVTDDLTHALYPAFADILWDYVKHFSRNQETGEVVYDRFVK
ncbi:hypothetical protein FACS18948_7010 [Clostridia bacterium]|nr:hypothetical protein FACS18948_7010 [Clostridia bacterium]